VNAERKNIYEQCWYKSLRAYAAQKKQLSRRMVNTQVDPELARAAVEAVSKWRYSPTLLNGDPIEVDMTVMVNFKLLP